MRYLPPPIRIFPLNRFLKKKFGKLFTHSVFSDIRAVRGPLTRTLCQQLGVSCPEIYGDPAIVLPRFFIPKPIGHFRYGIVLHHTQSTFADSEKIHQTGGLLISTIREGVAGVEAFINELVSCEKIFSSAMHGIITAQAYGIPAQWIRFKHNPIHQDDYHKFHDYFLGAGLTVQNPLNLSRNTLTENLVDFTKISVQTEIISESLKDRLLDVFPL